VLSIRTNRGRCIHGQPVVPGAGTSPLFHEGPSQLGKDRDARGDDQEALWAAVVLDHGPTPAPIRESLCGLEAEGQPGMLVVPQLDRERHKPEALVGAS
jgi:hypothetical protein